MIDYRPPTPLKIKRLREQIARKLNLNINQARIWCAQACIVRPPMFVDWENGEYEMPPGLFQLLQVKALLIDADLLNPLSDVPGRTYRHGRLKFMSLDPNPPPKRTPQKPLKKAS